MHPGIVISHAREGRRRRLLPEARAPRRALTTSRPRASVPLRPHADEICPTEIAVVAWAAQMGTITFHPWPVRSRRRRPPRRAAHRPRPAAGHRLRRRRARRRRGPHAARRARLRRLPEDLGRARRAHLRAHRAALDLHRRAPRRHRLRPRARAPDARPGDDEVVEGGARRDGVRRLQPERARPHDRLGLQRPARSPARPSRRRCDVGRARPRSRPRTSPSRTMPARFAEVGDRHAAIDDVGARPRSRCSTGTSATRPRARRHALPARLPEDAGRAQARAALARPRPQARLTAALLVGLRRPIRPARLAIGEPRVTVRRCLAARKQGWRCSRPWSRASCLPLRSRAPTSSDRRCPRPTSGRRSPPRRRPWSAASRPRRSLAPGTAAGATARSSPRSAARPLAPGRAGRRRHGRDRDGRRPVRGLGPRADGRRAARGRARHLVALQGRRRRGRRPGRTRRVLGHARRTRSSCGCARSGSTRSTATSSRARRRPQPGARAPGVWIQDRGIGFERYRDGVSASDHGGDRADGRRLEPRGRELRRDLHAPVRQRRAGRREADDDAAARDRARSSSAPAPAARRASCSPTSTTSRSTTARSRAATSPPTTRARRPRPASRSPARTGASYTPTAADLGHDAARDDDRQPHHAADRQHRLGPREHGPGRRRGAARRAGDPHARPPGRPSAAPSSSPRASPASPSTASSSSSTASCATPRTSRRFQYTWYTDAEPNGSHTLAVRAYGPALHHARRPRRRRSRSPTRPSTRRRCRSARRASTPSSTRATRRRRTTCSTTSGPRAASRCPSSAGR